MDFRHCSKATKPFRACKSHAHNFWEMIYQCSGKTRAKAGDSEFDMAEGDILVVPPNTFHISESDEYITDMWISFEKYDFPPFPFVVKDENGDIKKLFEVIYNISKEDKNGQEYITQNLFEVICLFVKKAYNEKDTPDIIGIVKRKLEENVDNSEFDVTGYIVSLGYNPDYFRRMFKSYTAFSPFVYLNNLRMKKAEKLLLANPFFSISEIASLCGFEDSLYFSTCFKKYTGISPSQYKKGSYI